MGLFSGKTIYTVETSTSPVIDNNQFSEPMLEALMKAVLEDSSIPESLVDSYSSSVGYQVDKMHRYARDNYPQGMMKSTVLGNTGHASLIKDAIAADTGHTEVTLQYSELSPLNYHHVAWERLVSDYGYDAESNELTGLSASLGGVVYLETFLVRMPTQDYEDAESFGTHRTFGASQDSGYTPQRPANSLAQYVTAPITAMPEARSDILIEVIYQHQEGGTLTKGTETFVVADQGNDRDVFQVRYTSGGSTYFWSYEQESGGHPALDGLLEINTLTPGTYLPVIYFRRNFTNLSHSSRVGNEEYDAASKAMDILGMDYSSVGDSIHESDSIDKVRNAYLIYGASGNSSDPVVLHYLWTFFSTLFDRASADEDLASEKTVSGFPDVENKATPGNATAPLQERARRIGLWLRPSRSLGDHNIGAYMFVNVRGITRHIRGGKLGEVGSFHRTTTTDTHTVSYRATVRTGDNGETTSETRTKEVSHPVLVLRYQTTPGTYEELRIQDPQLRHKIDGSGRHTRNGLGDPNLLIPLDHDLVADWGTMDRGALYQRCMHFVFNARDKQELEWYETGFFKFVLVVIAVVITIYTGIPAYQAMAATFAAGGITALAMAVLTAIVKMAAFQAGFKLIAKELGPEFAMIAAVVAAVYGGAKAIRAGSIENAPWASELLQASSGLSKASAGEYQRLMGEYQSEAQAFNLMQQQAYEELEEANDLLEMNSLLDPFSFIGEQPMHIPGESPENFYQRTIHSGNIGTVAFDAIHSYVDMSLKLPDFHDTAKELTYG